DAKKDDLQLQPAAEDEDSRPRRSRPHASVPSLGVCHRRAAARRPNLKRAAREEIDGRLGGAGHGVHFLDACFLCRKPLAGNRDIFMYRGDTAFCSDDCRSAQMAADEAAERKALTHGARPTREAAEAPQQEHRGKVRTGSILAL
ncbi:unnamed protein product, partial [Urochloa humidicola]